MYTNLRGFLHIKLICKRNREGFAFQTIMLFGIIRMKNLWCCYLLYFHRAKNYYKLYLTSKKIFKTNISEYFTPKIWMKYRS